MFEHTAQLFLSINLLYIFNILGARGSEMLTGETALY